MSPSRPPERSDRGAASLHLGRRSGGSGISRSAGTTAACGSRVAAPTIPKADWAATPGAQIYDHLFGSGRFSIWTTPGAPASTPQLTNNPAYMRFYDISYLDRLVNDLFVEDDTGRSPLCAHRLLFPGPARHRRAALSFPMCCRSWIITYIPDRQCGGRPVPLRHQQRRPWRAATGPTASA